MEKIFVCLLFSCAFHISVAQIKEIDSLHRLLAATKEDTIKVQVLVRLSYYDGSFEHGLQLAQEGLALAKKIKYKKGEANCLHQIANQFRSINNYTLALHYYLESLKIKEQLDDKEGYSRTLNGIGGVYKKQGDYRSALSYFSKAYEIQKEIKFNYGIAYTSSNIGEAYEAMNELGSALLHFQNSYAYFNSGHDKFQMVKALNGLGSVQSKMGNTDLALSYYRLGTINATTYADSIELADNYLGLAKLFQKTGQTDTSIIYAKMAISVTQNKYGEVVIEANKLLFKLFLNKNDREAIKYLTLSMDAKDSSYNATKSLQIQNLLYNEQERPKEIVSVESKATEERKQNLQYAAIALGLVAFVILFLLFSHSVVANQNLIKFLGILSLLIVFEFINLLIHPYLANFTGHSPVLMLGIMVCIAALLIPLHHRLEKWITHRLVEKNKKIRLAAAKKTIEKLEG